MLVMLCTRCQQREAWLQPIEPETRAVIEARIGAPWTFRDDLCRECLKDWSNSPEGKAQLEPLRRAMDARWKEQVEKWKDEARAGVLKVLDVADAIAGRI